MEGSLKKKNIGTKTKDLKSLLIVFKDISENLQINLHFLFSYDGGGTI